MGSAKPSASARRFFRQGPSGWDVRPPGWVEGMPIPVAGASAAGVGAHGGGGGSYTVPTQQTRHARRLYVGGLEAVPEAEIAELFSAIIRAALVTPLPPDVSPVLSVYINPERKFAFVEVATIELTSALMALDGLVYKGNNLKIRRPHDYKPELLPAELRERAEPLNFAVLGNIGIGGGAGGGGGQPSGATGIGTTGNRDSAYRIFVGGLPSGVDEAALGELMGAFGAIKHLHIVRGAGGEHKGYGFCEYADPAVTDMAVAALNGMSLGDRTITVSRAKGGPGGGVAAPPAAAQPMMSMAAMGLVDPAAFGLAPRAAPLGQPSRCVCLLDMVDVADLTSDRDYGEICEDVAEEASKHGTMKLTVRPSPHAALHPLAPSSLPPPADPAPTPPRRGPRLSLVRGAGAGRGGRLLPRRPQVRPPQHRGAVLRRGGLRRGQSDGVSTSADVKSASGPRAPRRRMPLHAAPRPLPSWPSTCCQWGGRSRASRREWPNRSVERAPNTPPPRGGH